MAAVAQLRLALHQEVLLFLGVMGRVAIETPDLAAGVRRLRKMRLRMGLAVATQAAGAAGLPRFPGKAEYLVLVAAPGHMVCPRTMAAFATLLGGAAFFIQRGLPVRRFLPAVVNFLVTGLAGLRADVLGSVLKHRGGWFALFVLVRGQRQRSGEGQQREQRNRRRNRQPVQEPAISFSECRHVHTFSRKSFLRISTRHTSGLSRWRKKNFVRTLTSFFLLGAEVSFWDAGRGWECTDGAI